MFALPLTLLALAASAFGYEEPKPPKLTFLFTVNINLTQPGIQLGSLPLGSRAIQTIKGGKFWGPKLNGEYITMHIFLA